MLGMTSGSTLQVPVVAVEGVGLPPVPALSLRALKRIEQGRKNQSDLARAMGLHKSHVSLIFAGKRQPSLDVAAGLAARLRVSLDEFYTYLTQTPTLTVN
jgi:transcriptional regulator with XRE-family HTH domain